MGAGGLASIPGFLAWRKLGMTTLAPHLLVYDKDGLWTMQAKCFSTVPGTYLWTFNQHQLALFLLPPFQIGET